MQGALRPAPGTAGPELTYRRAHKFEVIRAIFMSRERVAPQYEVVRVVVVTDCRCLVQRAEGQGGGLDGRRCPSWGTKHFVGVGVALVAWMLSIA